LGNSGPGRYCLGVALLRGLIVYYRSRSANRMEPSFAPHMNIIQSANSAQENGAGERLCSEIMM
jgi:hypothetical protein